METTETTIGHYGQWIAVVIWVVMFGVFLVFTPFNQKSQRKPSGVYLAFVVAMAFEMFGVPMSMYILSWVLGKSIPEGFFWGHTLVNQIGLTGLYLAYAASRREFYWSCWAGRKSSGATGAKRKAKASWSPTASTA